MSRVAREAWGTVAVQNAAHKLVVAEASTCLFTTYTTIDGHGKVIKTVVDSCVDRTEWDSRARVHGVVSI
jgi:hypothetical protein